MPGLVDDRILALSDRFLLPLVVLLLTYASFMLLPFAMYTIKQALKRFLSLLSFLLRGFFSRSTGFFLDVPYKKSLA